MPSLGLRGDVADSRQPLRARPVDVGPRLVAPQRLGVGIEDHLAAQAVDDDRHPRPDLVPQPLDTDDVGQPQRARHDRGVGGAPAPLGAEAGRFGATELRGVRRRQLVRHGDAPLGRVLGRSRLPAPHQRAQQALTDQRDVALAVAEVGVLNLLEHRLDLVERLAHGPLGRGLLLADHAAGALDQVDVRQHQPVRLQDPVLVIVPLGRRQLGLDAGQLLVGVEQRLLETLDLDLDLIGGDPAFVDVDAAGEDVGDADGDAGRRADADQPLHSGSIPSPKPLATRSARAATATSASSPSQTTFIVTPCAATRVRRPMMLLPLASVPSLMTLTSHLKPLALCTKRTAARACMPSRFLTCTSRSARDIV